MPATLDSPMRLPISVLVVVYSSDGQVLLLNRSKPFDFWQSITGSLKDGEHHSDAARRELHEETGLDAGDKLVYTGVSRVFVIDPRWRNRFRPGVVENVEFEWRLELDAPVDIVLDSAEHSNYEWVALPAATDRVWSWTNREALEDLALTLQ